MLILSSLLILAGAGVLGAAVLAATYKAIASGGKLSFKNPGNWPQAVKIWLRIAGFGIAAVAAGMALAAVGTQ